MISWNLLPKMVLAHLIIDQQLPIAASPTRQDKTTLVEALLPADAQRRQRTPGRRDRAARSAKRGRLSHSQVQQEALMIQVSELEGAALRYALVLALGWKIQPAQEGNGDEWEVALPDG